MARKPVKTKEQGASSTKGFTANREKLDAFAALGKDLDAVGWKHAGQVLTEVRAVPTMFPQVDLATRVHGWPTERFCLVHGPSNEGKTAFLLGLLASFLARGHGAAMIDAEKSTPSTWVRQLFGELATAPGFRAFDPPSYEATVDAVRAYCEVIGNARAAGKLDQETTAIVGLDSIRKLVPKRLLETLLKEGADGDEARGPGGRKKKPAGVDGMSGRAAMYKAALNTAWMDELTVLLKQTGCAMVVIGREYENSDPSDFFGEDFKLGGGQGLIFESSLRVRVCDRVPVKDGDRMVGEQHTIEIRKTKIAHKEEKVPHAHFHTSNGVLVPAGFDRARDVVELGVDCGVIDKAGAWFSFDGERLGQGVNAAVKLLSKMPELLERVEQACRKSFPRAEGA
jgi:recombination protein RecA